MTFEIQPFDERYMEEASRLSVKQYEKERLSVRSLPFPENLSLPRFYDYLKPFLKNLGVAAFSNGVLIGYMVTGGFFTFKGQRAAIVPEFAHASIEVHKSTIYERLYMALAAHWIAQKVSLHIIGHLAHDDILKNTLYLLGFGAILTERIRDLTPIDTKTNHPIKTEINPKNLVSLDQEHLAFYPASPTFIWKDTDPNNVLQDLQEGHQSGVDFLVYEEEGIPAGYFSIGESACGAEGFLMQKTNTAQIKSAFIKPHLRSKGIGASLLQESIRWASVKGFERLFVEHETANYYGSHFWKKYFQEYLYFSMRYIDPKALQEKPGDRQSSRGAENA